MKPKYPTWIDNLVDRRLTVHEAVEGRPRHRIFTAVHPARSVDRGDPDQREISGIAVSYFSETNVYIIFRLLDFRCTTLALMQRQLESNTATKTMQGVLNKIMYNI